MSSLILKSHRFASVHSIGALEQKVEGLSRNVGRLAEETEENGLQRGCSQGPDRRAASHLGFSPLQLALPSPLSSRLPLQTSPPRALARGLGNTSSLLSPLASPGATTLAPPSITSRPRAVLRE